ncbi:hypothetical protein AB4039_12445 [Streptomyces sp. M-16]|uniref:DUF6924 domain-containing protein n=1 Tax=Streptomyces sp. M-16 TaxID=3233040 RepID=UPI00225785F0
MATLLVRTDFAHPRAWQELCETVQAPSTDGFLADTATIDDTAYRGLPPEQILQRLPTRPQDRLLAVADTTTCATAGRPVLVIDLLRPLRPLRSLRVLATELWSIDNNLTLGNMDYHEFLNAADENGIFRGF